MNSLRDKFISYGIPYDEIDPEMIDVLDIFNFQLGLKTKFCCYGHLPYERSYIVFDEDVTDKQIYQLVEQTSPFVNYYKWVRYSPVMTNWTCEIGAAYKDSDCTLKKDQLDMISSHLRKCNGK